MPFAEAVPTGESDVYASGMVLAGAVQTAVDLTAATVLVFALVGAFTMWRAARAARRRWQRWRRTVTIAGQVRRAPTAVAAVASLPVTDVDWWLRQRDRHRMWRSVAAAERAVRAARRADAPLGDLVVLSRQLRGTARTVDALAQAGGRRPQSRQRVDEVVAAAASIQAVATESLLTVAAPETTGIAAAVELEIAALRHGLAAAGHR